MTGFVLGGVTGLASLLLLRFVLGGAEATTYPVGARAVSNWIPEGNRALANSFVIAGLPLGSAITPPLVSTIRSSEWFREHGRHSGGCGVDPTRPVLAERFGWNLAFASGSLASGLCVLSWLGIRLDDE